MCIDVYRHRQRSYAQFVPIIFISADTKEVRESVKAALTIPDCDFIDTQDGYSVMEAVGETVPDLAILDMQAGNMGGMATCLELRLEESAGRLGYIPVLLMVDRRPDVFLARRSRADGWIVKPLNPIKLRKAAQALLNGEEYQDDSYLPSPV